MIWARKKTGAPVIQISSVAEAEGILRKYQTFLVGQFDKFEVSEVMVHDYQTRDAKLTGGSFE